MATGKRELISPRGDKRFIRRDTKGRIIESDDVGRSLAQDRRRQAKTTAPKGQGDKGDRKVATKRGAAAGRKTASRSASTTRASATRGSKTASKSTLRGTATGPGKRAARAAPARKSAARATAPNAIQLLKADHVLVRKLLGELEGTTSRGVKTRVELLARIRRELEVHTTIEEEIFYPAFKAAGARQDDDKLYFEAMEEHRAAGELVLPDLLATDPASECFGGRAKVLKELIEHHAKEEEREMFPRARELLTADELKSLGERMQARKQALLAQPAPPKSAAGRLLSAVVGAITPMDPTEPVAMSRKRSGDGAGDASIVNK